MCAMTTCTCLYRQGSEVFSLLLESTCAQTVFEAGQRFIDVIIWVASVFVFVTADTGITALFEVIQRLRYRVVVMVLGIFANGPVLPNQVFYSIQVPCRLFFDSAHSVVLAISAALYRCYWTLFSGLYHFANEAGGSAIMATESLWI